jgi:hypothetical protein
VQFGGQLITGRQARIDYTDPKNPVFANRPNAIKSVMSFVSGSRGLT